MEDIREKKAAIRSEVISAVTVLDSKKQAKRSEKIQERLFSFANFREANIVLLFVDRDIKLSDKTIVEHCLSKNKVVVLPAFDKENFRMTLLKLDNYDDLMAGPRGIQEPNASRCKKVPIDRIDIALIPGLAFDEKGGRIGSGDGFYDRLIPRLPITTRKVALACEEQIVQQVPMESHDKYVDIVITDKRVIYKI